MILREIDLDERGRAYVLNHLRGVNLLCDGLARIVEANHGRVFTVAPTDTDESRIYEFEFGGLFPENVDFSRATSVGPGQGWLIPVTSLVDERAARIINSLSANPGSVCVCDDFNPEWPSELARAASTAFGVGTQTYHLLNLEHRPEIIADTLSWTDTVWHGVAAVGRQGLAISPRREASEEALSDWAPSVIELSCTAYDREGFVVWRRLEGD